jgi:hypothetical protein
VSDLANQVFDGATHEGKVEEQTQNAMPFW